MPAHSSRYDVQCPGNDGLLTSIGYVYHEDVSKAGSTSYVSIYRLYLDSQSVEQHLGFMLKNASGNWVLTAYNGTSMDPRPVPIDESSDEDTEPEEEEVEKDLMARAEKAYEIRPFKDFKLQVCIN